MTLAEFIGIAIAALVPAIGAGIAFLKSHYALSNKLAAMEAAHNERFKHLEHDVANDKEGRKAMQQVLIELATLREQMAQMQAAIKRLFKDD